jgi:ABC-type nitrate/sulfonate/bicarbonate transport system substrate-binding protein
MVRHTPAVRRALLATAAVALTLLSGCGATRGAGGTDDATLSLGSPPRAIHAGIYTALARDFDGGEGVRLRIREARGEFTILSAADLAAAREDGVDMVGVMAITQQPLIVLATTRQTLDADRDLVDGTVAALRRGYEEVLKDPELAVETMVRRVPALDREALLRDLRRVSPAFTAGVARFGDFDRARLEAFANRRGIDVDAAFLVD